MGSHLHLQYPLACTNRSNLATSPFSSAIHILRTYNNLLTPSADLHENIIIDSSPRLSISTVPSPSSYYHPSLVSKNEEKGFGIAGQHSPTLPSGSSILTYQPIPKFYQIDNEIGSPISRPLLLGSNHSSSLRRQRGEKKPIPVEQKDEKYFERRKRNNQAAKKSRDARKIREDQIALRATMLEHENAILRAQVLTLREEAASIKRMFFLKKTAEDLQLQRSPK